MAYAVINKSGCVERKGNVQIRLDFFLNHGDPRYEDTLIKGKATPFHTHFVYFGPDVTEDDIKAEVDFHLPNFYKAYQDRWDEVKGGMRHGWATEKRITPIDYSKDAVKVVQCQDRVDSLAEFSHKPEVGEGKEYPATEIDIGADAIGRLNNYVYGRTLIDLANPANDTGIIDTFEVWADVDLTGTNKVGTFYGSGTAYTNRDGAVIGTVTAGAKRTFTGLSIDVTAGDFAGIYYSAGFLERSTSGGSGVYYKTGNQFGAGAQTYALLGGDAISIYGTGDTEVGETHYGSATLAGTGTLAAVGQRITYGIATLAGIGNLAASAITILIGKATLAGAGALSAIGRGVFAGSATLAGLGTLTANAVLTAIGKATTSGIGTLSAIGTVIAGEVIHYGSALLSGIGTLSVIGQGIFAGAATLSGLGSLSAIGKRITYGLATLAGQGSLTANGFITAIGKATLAGVGSLSAIGSFLHFGKVTLAGAGTLAAIGSFFRYGAATLAGAGTLTAVGRGIYAGAAQLQGVGSLAASAVAIFAGKATLAGQGFLTVKGALGRLLKVIAITSQYRIVNVVSSQKRSVRAIASLYRKVKAFTSGG